MKTSQKLYVLLFLITLSSFRFLNAQDYPTTIIDVYGSRYGDTMWLFTIEGTTPGYDWGWDGVKIFGSTLAPAVYAIGIDNYYQVYSSDNIHNTQLGFRAGEDSLYTFRFTNNNLSPTYEGLYLFDKKTNKIIDIFSAVSNYAFTCSQEDEENRFTIITYLTEKKDSVPDSEDKNPNKGKGNNQGKSNPKSLIAFTLGTNLFVDNRSAKDGEAVIFDPSTGAKLIRYDVKASGITSVNVNLKSGNYIVSVTNGIEIYNTLVAF